MFGKLDLRSSYQRLVDRTKAIMPGEEAVKHAVGGEFEGFGIVEMEMLRFYGLTPSDSLIDVGCGSGRLAIPLSRSHPGAYLGTDLVPDLVAHAKAACARPDWRFEIVSGLTIPAADAEADMVCLFSVLTHLLHEQSYLYLEEVRRVLRPGGRIVFSFLEYAIESHWNIFAKTVADERSGEHHPLNVFMDRDAIAAWARRLDLRVDEIRRGDEPFVPLAHPVKLDGGGEMAGLGHLGQSICVLSKPG